MTKSVLGWQELFIDYVNSINDYWPATRIRQGKKLESAIEVFRTRNDLTDTSAAIEKVLEIAKLRFEKRPMTIFLVSPGSSGSHWLEAVLSKSMRFVSCGEVYLPNDILKLLVKMPPADKSAFIDCVHVAHARADMESLQSSTLINSAHQSGWRLSQFMASPTNIVLLLRDPIDIVISRTFRKPGYRVLFDDVENDQFLSDNIDYVTRFFDTASSATSDVVVRFENMRDDLGCVIKAIAEKMDIDITQDHLDATVKDLGYVRQKDKKKVEVKTNVYKGPEINISTEVRESLELRLSAPRKAFGYGR